MAASDQLALTGMSSWTVPLLGYGLLLIAAGVGLFLIRRRPGASGRHTP